jgi:hypothetical protein
MAELTTRDGMPAPAGLPQGECFMTSLSGGHLRVDRADPRILISGEVLDAIVRGGGLDPAVDWPALNAWLTTAGCVPGHGYVGAVLHIRGVNRQVVYRIVDMVPRINGYIAEWPD